jgi:GNAT superfamily N-acetyltransferase
VSDRVQTRRSGRTASLTAKRDHPLCTETASPAARTPSGMPGTMSGVIVRTYLEIDDPAGLRPAAPPRVDGVRVARVEPPNGEVSRWFYVEVGGPHNWVDNLGRSAAEWQAWAERVETWVVTVAGERAGYYELRADDGSVEVAYFGLLAAFHGAGLGGFLLTHALRRGFELAPRVWLHTNTQDGPAALPNYLARGLRPFRTETLGE